MQGPSHGEEPGHLAWDARTGDLDDPMGGLDGDVDRVHTAAADPPAPVESDEPAAPEPEPAAPEPEPAAPDPAAPDPAAPELDAPPPAPDPVLDGIAALAATLEAVHAQTRDAVRVQRRHAEHVDELHAENQRLRRGELASALAPMVRDVIRLHDEITRLAAVAVPEAADDIGIVGERILDLLARWGITAFTPEHSAPFDPGAHRGVGHADDVTSPVQVVVQVMRGGFCDADGKVIRPADVIVTR